MNKQGYAIKELLILFGVLAIVFTVAITKVSFAYQEAVDTDNLLTEENNTIKLATQVYIKANPDKIDKEKENFLFGKDLTEAGYLIQTEEFDYSKTKIKVTYNKETKEYNIEVME